MNLFTKSLLCVAITVFVTSVKTQILVGQTDSKEAARQIFEGNSGKVFGLKALVQISASMQGKQAMSRETSVYANGTVIEDGILLASYRSIRPNATASVRGAAPGLAIKTEVKEIQLVDESGEEFDAKLVLHDEDLDIAFIALDRDSENAGDWSADKIDISQDIELTHLDEVVIVNRSNAQMKFQPTVRMGQVNTIIPRPRRLYSVAGLPLSGAVFNLDGQFVGLSVRKTTGSGGEFSAVLPAKYIRKLLPQAIEKAANMEDEDESGDEGSEAEENSNTDEESDTADESDEKKSDSKDDDSSKDDSGGDGGIRSIR